jgi:hypothetical protein
MYAGILRILIAAFSIALLASTASAQGAGGAGDPSGSFGGSHHRQQGKTDKAPTAKPKVDEKAYNAALKELPDKHYDAWHGVR